MALFGREKKIKYLRKIPILQGRTRQQLVAVARMSDITEVPAGTPLARSGGGPIVGGTSESEQTLTVDFW